MGSERGAGRPAGRWGVRVGAARGRRRAAGFSRGRSLAPAVRAAGGVDAQGGPRQRRAAGGLLSLALPFALDGARARRGLRGAALGDPATGAAAERARGGAALARRLLLRAGGLRPLPHGAG